MEILGKDFHKCIDPRTDQQPAQNSLRCGVPFGERLGIEEKKNVVLFLFLTYEGKNKMRVTTFFKKILRLKSAVVEGVRQERIGPTEEGSDSKGIAIRVATRWKSLRCGNCGRKSVARHGRKGKTRKWRHLGVWGTPVWLVGRVCRVVCSRCGVRTMAVPWARVGSPFTRAFEDEVAWFMQKTNQTATAQYFGISWPTAGKIARRVVSEKIDKERLENLRLLGIDEISYGRPRKFLTVVVDHQQHRVIWAAEGQSAKTLTEFFQLLGPEKCSAIEAVSIDMDPAFEKAIRENLPNAQIVYDRFHIVQLLSRAVDQIRRDQVRNAPPDEKVDLKGARYPLLKNPWNLKPAEERKLATVQKTNQPLYRGYLLKETFQTLYDASTPEQADTIFNNWFAWARRSKLEPFKKLALTLKEHYNGIRLFIEKKLTNAPVEGFNSKIRMISHRAFGFHSAQALIAMILLNCSGIKLEPVGW